MSVERVHVGIDLAWGPNNLTGLATVGADGRLLDSGSARTDNEIVDWIGAHAPQRGVVAIDAPLIVTNPTGRRQCESLIQAAFGPFDASPYPANLGNPHFNPPRGAVLAQRLGLPIDRSGSREGVAIEVYPHPAMVGLWRLDLTLKYKNKKNRPIGFRREEFARLLDLLESDTTLRAVDLPRWSKLVHVASTATKQSHLDHIEDEVDGIVCAWIAWLWSKSDARLRVYGNAQEGYIVAPAAPTHAHRPWNERHRQDAEDSRGDELQRPHSAGTDPVTFRKISGASDTRFALNGPTGTYGLSPHEARLLEATLADHRDG